MGEEPLIFRGTARIYVRHCNVAPSTPGKAWIRGRVRAGDSRKVLDMVELPVDDDFLRRYPHELSGGEVQRVSIARALALGPRLLIADEPTSALDPSVQAKILRLLMNLQDRTGLSMLFITHGTALARKISDRMAVMQNGRIVEVGPTNEVLIDPEHDYTRRLVESVGGLFEGIIATKSTKFIN